MTPREGLLVFVCIVLCNETALHRASDPERSVCWYRKYDCRARIGGFNVQSRLFVETCASVLNHGDRMRKGPDCRRRSRGIVARVGLELQLSARR